MTCRGCCAFPIEWGQRETFCDLPGLQLLLPLLKLPLPEPCPDPRLVFFLCFHLPCEQGRRRHSKTLLVAVTVNVIYCGLGTPGCREALCLSNFWNYRGYWWCAWGTGLVDSFYSSTCSLSLLNNVIKWQVRLIMLCESQGISFGSFPTLTQTRVCPLLGTA